MKTLKEYINKIINIMKTDDSVKKINIEEKPNAPITTEIVKSKRGRKPKSKEEIGRAHV